MHRRSFLVLGLAAAASPALAQAPGAPKKTVEVGEVFPYLVNYLRLPAADRDRWTLGYYFNLNGKPAETLSAWIEHEGRRTPVTFGPEGRASPLPTLAQLTGDARFGLDVPTGTKMSISLRPEPTLKPAASYAAADLTATVRQAGRGARKAAPLAVRMLAPKFESVGFVGATGGEVVHADGRTFPLPLEKGVPVFKPAAHADVTTVRFKTPPRRLNLG